MRSPAAVLLVLSAVAALAAGCLQPAAQPEAVDLPQRLVHAGHPQEATDQEALVARAVPGPGPMSPAAVLEPGETLEWIGACPCPAYRLRLGDVPEGGWLDVRVRWEGRSVPDLGLSVLAPDGRAWPGERGFDDRLARVHDAEAGTYEVRVTGLGAFQASARWADLEVPATGDRLPNLAEQVIEGPHIGPCDQVERTEQGAVKCLRFGNGVANPGHGPMQIRLTLDQGVSALATVGGRFVQEVRQADGTLREREVGPAVFHPTHSHWHYDGFALFELYAVDPATGLRGPLASAHHKSGFCFLDWDRMPENTTEPAEQERAETDCLLPGASLGGSSWTNGISRGWYDFYEQQLTDQYVDVAGLPDGVYELVATADPLHTLDELDDTDNQSSLLLRLAGDEVEVLEERAHYRVQPDDDH